jgi:hypothetical protein
MYGAVGSSEEASVKKLHPQVTEDVIDFWLQVQPKGRGVAQVRCLLLSLQLAFI